MFVFYSCVAEVVGEVQLIPEDLFVGVCGRGGYVAQRSNKEISAILCTRGNRYGK